jgi:hypothetical protein
MNGVGRATIAARKEACRFLSNIAPDANTPVAPAAQWKYSDLEILAVTSHRNGSKSVLYTLNGVIQEL